LPGQFVNNLHISSDFSHRRLFTDQAHTNLIVQFCPNIKYLRLPHCTNNVMVRLIEARSNDRLQALRNIPFRQSVADSVLVAKYVFTFRTYH
jgi:hypothetical protein